MNAIFDLDRDGRELFDHRGRRFDVVSRTWTLIGLPSALRASGLTRAWERPFALMRSADNGASCEPVDAVAAVTWLQRESGHPLRVPVGVIGPREATAEQLAAGLRVGELLADCGLVVICGGRTGVMQAVCEGVARVGGLSVGLLPDADPSHANPFVKVAIATGIGEARNALIARAAFALIAIGDSLGTLSEVALGRQFGKLVVGLEGAARVEGVVHVATPEAAVAEVAAAVLGA